MASVFSNSGRRRVVVTGMGCISSIGVGVSETTAGLLVAKDGIRPVETFDVSKCQGKTAGQIEDIALRPWVSGRRRGPENRATQMMRFVIAEALDQHASFVPEIAVIGTTSGGMPLGEKFFRAATTSDVLPAAAPSWVRGYVPQAPVLDSMRSFGWQAPCRVLSNACASGTNALGHALALVRSGKHERVLCGGYDVLCQLVFAGFDALRAYTGEKCRPFDANRTGLVLGEGAAVFFLESMDSALANGRVIFAEVAGYGASTDNHHLTQPNPDGSGPRLAMERALADAGICGEEIDYVNAHGTATPFNDACEAKAIAAITPEASVSSTKGQTGHTLGAAGALEAAFCVIALQNGFYPANINFRSLDPGVSLNLVENVVRHGNISKVLSNSLGFGGANASILLERAVA